MVQKGVGQGTVTRLRRNPRERVEDVAIAEASGLTLGADGYPHPIETTALGEVKVWDRSVVSLLEELLEEFKAIRQGMVNAGMIQDVE